MENRKIKTMLIMMLLSVFAVSAIFPLPVHAEGEGQSYKTSFSVEISDPKNNIPDDTEFVLKLETDSHAPLPDPAEMTVGKSGSYTFPEIEFTEPGNYHYTIRQFAPQDEKIICDSKVYEITVTVIRTTGDTLEGCVTFSTDAATGKPTSITFENDYKNSAAPYSSEDDTQSDTKPSDSSESSDPTSSDPSAPLTGEPLSPAFGGLLLSGLLFALFFTVKSRKSEESSR